ncbi:MAG: T9SS type A sorting domain-containing protein [Bacteroidetes bacterium]|nr:T9SS type A sorting domain-containing protein [Bacteroidota bacterium]
MKKNYMLIGLLVVTSISFAWQKNNAKEQIGTFVKHKFTSGGPPGRTGAPNEGNCTSCHQGTAISGSSENIFMVKENGNPVNNYTVGTQYEISLQMASNPSKKGFQTTVLNTNNQFAGTLTSINSGVSIVNGSGGKQYANHTFQGSSGSNFPIWTFNWTAPANDAGPVIFYIATNKTNSDGGDSGDQIHLSQFSLGSLASVVEYKESVEGFRAAFSASNSTIQLQFNSSEAGSSFLNLVDLNGKSVLSTDLNETQLGANKLEFKVPEYVKSGMYIVHFFVNNNAKSQSIMIQ